MFGKHIDDLDAKQRTQLLEMIAAEILDREERLAGGLLSG